MTLQWPSLILLFSSLICVHSLPVAVLHTKYITSYRLVLFTRCRVQQLLTKYKEEQLGSKDYEDRSQHLKELPSLSTDFYSWLKMTDEERLGTALWDVQVFWDILKWKREQLTAADSHSPLHQSMQHIECDLRDLTRQVIHQMNHTGSTRAPVGRTVSVRSGSRTRWDSRVEGYIILRDLNLYLTKLARDFLLLATKASPTTGAMRRETM
ncbi:unnamed protein product [Knipowitschia caucasica]